MQGLAVSHGGRSERGRVDRSRLLATWGFRERDAERAFWETRRGASVDEINGVLAPAFRRRHFTHILENVDVYMRAG